VLKYIHKAIKTKKGNTDMESTTQSKVEAVTMSEVLSLATWDRPRSSEELLSFIERRESTVGR